MRENWYTGKVGEGWKKYKKSTVEKNDIVMKNNN